MDRTATAQLARRMADAEVPGAEIARRLNVAPATVYRWLRGGGAKPGQPSRHPAPLRHAARTLWAGGSGAREIADSLGVSVRTVYRWVSP